MMSVGLHCRLVGRPGRAAALARFLDYVQGHERVWIARAHRHRRALAGAASGAGGAARGRRRLAEEAFVARFGGVFEHSPWIAERAPWRWSSGRRMIPRSASAARWRGCSARPREAERLGVLTAHPDLAGKLAAAQAADAGVDRGAGPAPGSTR